MFSITWGANWRDEHKSPVKAKALPAESKSPSFSRSVCLRTNAANASLMWTPAVIIRPPASNQRLEHSAAQLWAQGPHPSITPSCRNGLKSTHAWHIQSPRVVIHVFLAWNWITSVLSRKYLENFKKCQIKSEWTWLKQMLYSCRSIIRDEPPQNTKYKKKKLAEALQKCTARWSVSRTHANTASDSHALHPPCKHFEVFGKIFWKRKRDVL